MGGERQMMEFEDGFEPYDPYDFDPYEEMEYYADSELPWGFHEEVEYEP
jgi:hypothetical protein